MINKLTSEAIFYPTEEIKNFQLVGSRWIKLKEYLVTKLVGWIPSIAFGVPLRRFFYRLILSRLGLGVSIESNVEVYGAHNIEIEDFAHISRNVFINAQAQNNRVYIGSEVILERGIKIVELDNSKIEIGARTFINSDVWINGPGHIKIGQDCLIGPRSAIIANSREFNDAKQKINLQKITGKGIVIENDCWLGYGVTVLDGVTIGQGSVIGAGSVVTKDIPAYSVAVGVPAKVVSQRSR